MSGWWLADLWSSKNGQVLVVSWLVWVVGSITLHELGHGFAALRYGDDTPRRSGHITWNPVVHMGPYSLIALLLIGIAWGMMPVDPSRMKGRYAETKVLLAGPLVNLALFLIAAVLYALWTPLATRAGVEEPLLTNMDIFLRLGAMLNVVLFLFNLVPIPPLDGGRILMKHSGAYRKLVHDENGRWVLLGGFVLLFVFGAELLFGFGHAAVGGVSGTIRTVFF